jgi:hypothetical protein
MKPGRNILHAFLFLISIVSIRAQIFNNEWINLSQKYYKIKIAHDGVYRLDSAALAASGIPVTSIDPRNIQLFQKGKEIYPYIAGESDGVLNTSDYILFYAENNKGKDDSLLYNPNIPFLTNPYYSIINDTSVVFLTWNGSVNNNRLTLDTDTTFSQYNASPYYYKEQYTPGYGGYGLGPLNSLNLDDPRYNLGEGIFYGDVYESNPPGSFVFNTSALYTALPLAYFTVCVSGLNDFPFITRDHILQMSYSTNSGTQPLAPPDSLSGYITKRYTFPINPASLGANTTINVADLPNTGMGSAMRIQYVRVWLPRQFDLLNVTEEKIYLPNDNNQSKSKLVISSFNDQGTAPLLINQYDHSITNPVLSGSNYLALIPNSGNGDLQFCYLTSQANISAVASLEPVNGNGSFVDYQSQVTDSMYLIVTHPKLMPAAQTYKAYRSSLAGGNHAVLLADVNELYDQFAFGVKLHPSAIRNFCHSIIANPAKNPSNLFLMGKAIHSIDCIVGNIDPAGAYYAKNLVPSWGSPPSDALVTQGLPGSTRLEPAIPTGRLAAQDTSDIMAYLSKVELYEQQTGDSLWKKRALHFIGGSTASEQLALKFYMDDMQSIYQDTLIGGKVYPFYKTTTAPTTTAANDSVKQLIEGGVSMMTFFGHGSQTGFDQNIDDPQNYNNSPKFPIIVANSCYAGDLHSGDQPSHSEIYTLAHNNHGSIAYVATVSEGVANDLYYFSREFYSRFGHKNYGSTYGICMRATSKQLMDNLYANQYGADSNVVLAVLEMTYHGDPALHPYSEAKPDYAISNPDVIFDTGPTVPPDSIRVKIIITNLGMAIHDSIYVYMQRNFPNGDTATYIRKIKGPFFRDTLRLSIAKDYYHAVGLNNFTVRVNPTFLPQEITFLNNNTSAITLLIPGADIEPVWPYKYAIVPRTDSVTLKASTADPFAPLTTYKFQVDTSDQFLNPFVNTTVTAPGGVITLPISFSAHSNKDSMVYFWRVAKDSVWKESSFQVITGKYGWGQAHFHQFKNDAYQYVTYNKPLRSFDFVNDYKSIQVRDVVVGPWNNYASWTQVEFFYNNLRQRQWTCTNNGWTIAVIDSVTGNFTLSDGIPNGQSAPWTASAGNCICYSATPLTAFDFGSGSNCNPNSNQESELINFINSIPTGKYVLAYTTRLLGADTLQHSLSPAGQAAFATFGSSLAGNVTDTTVAVILGRKGMGIPAHEVISNSPTQFLNFTDSLLTHFTQGSITSEVIGPCMFSDTAWKSLHWTYEPVAGEAVGSDTVFIELYGIDANGQRFQRASFPIDSLNVLDLKNYVNGKQFPYIQLVAREEDNVHHTAPQLKRWQVIFDQAPEGAIDPPSGFSVVKSEVQEGEPYEIHIPFRNVSDFPFNDSLLFTYYVEDANRVNHYLPDKLHKKPLLPGAVMVDTLKVSSMGLTGNNTFWIDINPPGKPKYQGEQFHFNNIADVAFTVDKDKVNPLLDVTFDGVHILSGDIVSAKPNVYVSLRDENKFLALNDTSNFLVYLLPPGSSSEQRLFFKDALQFTPAQLPNNSCKINYHPTLQQDGMYTLHVKASDRSGNVSGQFDYRIQFDVINKASVTEVLNYPNPFSTSTRFVFTITGSDIPETFKIQILTITGRVVKEITREELGFLHIGRNITEYAWDGKDQFGDQLANGVYLYRVQTRLHGDEVEHMDTDADSYFKKGFGKMVLLR